MTGSIRTSAKLLKDIGHPVRLKILVMLMERERCLCEILPRFKISQPTMSRHLSVLKEHKLVSFRRDQNRTFYTIKDKRVLYVLRSLGFDRGDGGPKKCCLTDGDINVKR